MKRTSAALLALALTLASNLAWAAMTSSPSGIDDRLRIEWETVQSGRGRPVIDGYLYNDYKRPAANVIMLVESLDGDGRVTGRAISVLPGIVPAFGRTYFEVPLKSAGASYRIAVTSFEWYAGGAN